ncbi:MAG: DUF4249 domain-containing protein [Cyclobacteriaceae bacterium]|nr:DUF4249 domain-containing protein [Cyclobacteriaceae bacterium]
MRRFLFLVLIGAASCIEPINLKDAGAGGALVVDGWVTDQPGPYIIKLSRTIPYNNSAPVKVYSVPERGASVTIEDDLGNISLLTETTEAGSYATSGLTGVVGRSYQLKFQTSTGKKYASTIEKMPANPGLSAIKAEFQVSETIFINANGSSRIQKKEDFGIYVIVNDPAASENFYRWKANGVYEFFSVTDFADRKQCWAPTLTRLESQLQIASDTYFDGKEYKQFIGIFPYDRPTYYLLTVRQQSLTATAHSFLKRINIQQTSTGTLFDPPATPISGNIKNLDGSETVLGFFSACSEVQSTLLVNRFVESGRVNPSRYTAPKNGDCRLHEVLATNIKWPGFP